MNYFQKDIECMSRNKMNELQLERLKHTVAYAYEHTPLYRKRLDEVGVKPSDIQSLKDLEKFRSLQKRIFGIIIRLACLPCR